VKELKASHEYPNAGIHSLTWNPVKELKDEKLHLPDRQPVHYVESGEGIESGPVNPPLHEPIAFRGIR